tara:strand:+ start:582 stop:977 length:396 start_codon:yes stop_codon:yes gene_type:complete
LLSYDSSYKSSRKIFKISGKKLADGGLILIQDINTSFFMRLLLYLMSHQSFSYNHNIFDESLKKSLNEFLLFPLSGGVIAKYEKVESPFFVLKLIDLFDRAMLFFFPKLFALRRSVVLKKETDSNRCDDIN